MIRTFRLSLASWSLIALVAGLALGLVGHGSSAAFFPAVESISKPLGTIWLSALQLLLLPLIFSQLLSAITGAGEGSAADVGRLGARAIALFVAMLLTAGALTVFLVRPLVALYQVDHAMVASLEQSVVVPEGAKEARLAAQDLSKILPTNLVEAARKGDIFTILIFAALLGAAATRLPAERRVPFASLCRSFAEAMMTIVRWILVGTPVAVFALTYSASLRSGGFAAGMMGTFIALVCVMLALFTILLYPLTVVLGRTTFRAFARAAAPSQLVAISTLSSIAALPALIQGGADHLRLPARFTGFLLPLSVSVFKFNRTISSTTKVVFLAHVYGIPLSATTLAIFMVTVTLMSFGAVGVPNGGQAFTTLPAYVAAGIPLEGIILLEATSMAPDMLKTILNVTADMSAAAILSRSARTEAAVPVDDDPLLAMNEGAG